MKALTLILICEPTPIKISYCRINNTYFFALLEKKITLYKMSEETLNMLNLASHHEAGHVAYGYFVGWAVESVDVFIENDIYKGASTIYDFKADNDFLVLLNNNLNLVLTESNKSSLIKRFITTLGGSIAESKFLNKDFIKVLTRNESDLRKVLYFSKAIISLTDNKELPQKITQNATTLINLDAVESAVERISQLVVSSDNYHVNRSDIEIIINDCKIPLLDMKIYL